MAHYLVIVEDMEEIDLWHIILLSWSLRLR